MNTAPDVQFVPITRLGKPRFTSPLPLDLEPGGVRGRFVDEDIWVRQIVEIEEDRPITTEVLFEKAGPRHRIYFDPVRTRAAIVTCGGLCPGLNSVIRSVFLSLHYTYGVSEVIGLRNGYLGLTPSAPHPPILLSVDFVSEIHKEGGTMLGTSRGPQDLGVMVDFLDQNRIDILFCVGGDGTLRGAHAIHEELQRRRTSVSVVGIPKTIDNDVSYCDRTFGFMTAVHEARNVIHLAHTEARSTPGGIGLVKLMGRHSGFIACLATRASQEVNFVLIPEASFTLHGPQGFLAALERRIDDRDHAVVVVAEGAGQQLFETDGGPRHDASGNRILHDVGLRLRDEIVTHFHAKGRPIAMKYFDPSYIIRSVPPTTDDQLLCDELARRAVDAAMSGRTDVMVGNLHNTYIHVPIELACMKRRQVELTGEMWSSVLAATGQPPRFGP